MASQVIDMTDVRNRIPFSFIKILGIFILAFILFKASVVFIPPGYVGVLYDRGRGVVPEVLHEGMNFTIPFWQTVGYFDTRVQAYTMSIVPEEGAVKRDDSLDAPTSDGQQVKVDATVLFRIDPEKAPVIWKTIGSEFDYVEKLIRPAARSQIRMVISRYTASAIYSEKRQEAEDNMTKEIAAFMKSKNIIVDKVLLRSVNFSPEYSKAIESKMVAEQKVKQAEFEVKEASQRAQAQIMEAKGLAEAQSMQKATLTNEYLQLEAIKKWDGKLPQVVGSNSTPFINIPVK